MSAKQVKAHATSANQLFTMADQAEDNGRFRDALKLYKKAAALGDRSAENNLGALYCGKPGIKRNWVKALYWFKKAWRNGNEVHSCENIASTYADMGNARQARYWWKRAVKTGDGEAALGYAKFLMTMRRPIHRDIVRLLRKAANTEPKSMSQNGLEEARSLLRKFEIKSKRNQD